MTTRPKINMIPLIKFIRHFTKCDLMSAKILAEALVDANLVKVDDTYPEQGSHEINYPRKRNR